MLDTSSLKNIQLKIEGRIALIVMNRPKAMNALNNDTLFELNQIIQWANDSDEISGLIITGEGKSFVAGADISQMKDYDSEEGKKYTNFAQGIIRVIFCI